MTKNVKTLRLGTHETKLLFELERLELKTFTLQEASRILELPKSLTANVLYRLKKKGRILQLEKGKYLLIPARAGIEGYWSEDMFSVVDKLIQEYYIAFLTAMHYWDLTEQIPHAILVATPKRKSTMKIISQEIRFITVSRKRFFGFQEVKDGGRFKVSTLEKTILDGLIYPQHCNGLREVSKALWNAKDRLDWSRLMQYLERVQVSSALRRLGYLMNVLNIQSSIKFPSQFKGFRWLDPSSPKRVKGYSKRWGLILNLTEEELLAWKGS